MPMEAWKQWQSRRVLRQVQAHLDDTAPLDSITLLQKAVEMHPSHREAHRLLLSITQKKDRLSDLDDFYQRLAIEHPRTAMIHNYWGVWLFLSGRNDEALARFNDAKRLDENYIAPRNNIAMIMSQYGRFDEAIAEYERSVAIDPNNAVAHGNLGDAYQRVGKMDEALQHLKRAVELQTDSYNMNVLADYFFYRGDYTLAHQWYEQAYKTNDDSLTIDVDRMRYRLNFARCCLSLQRYEQVIDVVENCFKIKGARRHAGLHKVMGQAYFALGKIGQAIIHLERALKLSANNETAQAAIYRILAQVYYKTGEFHKASAAHQLSSVFRYETSTDKPSGETMQHSDLVKALELDPNDPHHHLALGQKWYEVGRWEEAIAELHKAVELKPDLVDAHRLIGWICMQLDQPRDAWYHINKTFYHAPHQDSSYVLLGVSALHEGEYERARNNLRQAVKLNSASAEAHNYLGDVYQHWREYDQAKACFEKSLELRPEFHLARYNLANVLHELGNLEEARKQLEILVAAQPTHLLAMTLLGDVLEDLGRSEEASTIWTKALAINPYYGLVQPKLEHTSNNKAAQE